MASFTSVSSAGSVPWPNSAPPPATHDVRAAVASAVSSGAEQPAAVASTSAHAVTSTSPAVPNKEQLGKIVSQLQSQVASMSGDLQFSVDHDTGQSVVKVLDKTTNSVIWQFPSEQALQMSKDIERSQKGVMVNKQA